ncbi:hypothetical protein CDD82_2711 [Ophiocordyceps australis]|uniref:Phosphatidate cytidylyltransferase, mitochondrial n=1 Tax=Ophiocordyceps australis TaxID=1399860 RepID=A0A2C5YLR1_9HYPO|nr:hypothetical protein CDD82_2711 [Ophiocordyceps australis]
MACAMRLGLRAVYQRVPACPRIRQYHGQAFLGPGKRWYSVPPRKGDNGSGTQKPSLGPHGGGTRTSKQPRNDAPQGKPTDDSNDWEDTVDFTIKSFEDLPHRSFGANQHMIINRELREALRIMLRQFNAPIVYCFAYGSGVFPQESSSRVIPEDEFRAVHPHPPEALMRAQRGSPKMIDFIFGVTHTQHWHSINMKQHRNHYSSIASFGSGLVSRVQDWGAGVYFNPYIEVNGMLIKYGVTSIQNLVQDLSTWNNLYLAGRLHKPVKILRDHPQVRLANQHNLIAAVRTALLLLPPDFSERDLYSTIAGLSYLGDPRMALPTENKSKVTNIVKHNVIHFRRLYAQLIKTLPNVAFTRPAPVDDADWVLDPEANYRICQDTDPVKRGNMVRRLPKHFRQRLYFRYQKKLAIPREEFTVMMDSAQDDEGKRRLGGEFERRIATDGAEALQAMVRRVIRQTVNWPSTTQSAKGLITAGYRRTIRYMGEKFDKWKRGRRAEHQTADVQQEKGQPKEGDKGEEDREKRKEK